MGINFSLSMRLSTNMPVNTEISFSQDFPPNNTATLRIKKHLRKKKFFRFGVFRFSEDSCFRFLERYQNQTDDERQIRKKQSRMKQQTANLTVNKHRANRSKTKRSLPRRAFRSKYLSPVPAWDIRKFYPRLPPRRGILF